MENIIYERDYAEEREKRVAATPAIYGQIFDHMVNNRVLKAYSDALNAIPKTIVPEDKEAYDNLLPRLDMLARRMGGKIKGEISHEKWEAYIILNLPYFECTSDEDHQLLADIAEKTHIFSITAEDDGNIRIFIMINYFTETCDKEKILEEIISKDKELVDLLTQEQEEQKNFALTNPTISAFIEESASEAGMTPSEFYDRLVRISQSDPELFEQTITKYLQKAKEDRGDSC